MKETRPEAVTERDLEGLPEPVQIITIADATGDEIDQGTLVRYLNEMMWFPTAYLNDYIQWEPIDSGSAKATISWQGLSASADTACKSPLLVLVAPIVALLQKVCSIIVAKRSTNWLAGYLHYLGQGNKE